MSKRTQRTIQLQVGNEVDLVVDVEEDVANKFETVRNIIEDIGDVDAPIPLPNINIYALEQAIKFAKHLIEVPPQQRLPDETNHKPGNKPEPLPIPDWDKDFVEAFNLNELLAVCLAANYLACIPLLSACTERYACLIRGKTSDEIRAALGLRNVYSTLQVKQMREEAKLIE